MSHTGVTSLPANVFVSHNLTNLQRLYVTHSDTLGKCPDNIMNFRVIEGTNLLLGPPEKFYRRNPSGTFRDVHWYHSGDPKKVPGAPSQGFLIFLGFDKNITKIEIWLSYPHFLADFQVSYHFGKLLTARSQGFTASKNQSLDQWDMSISKIKIWTP